MKFSYARGAAIIALALLFAFFAQAMNDSTRFAHRDVAFYYYPLFEYVQRLWETGTPPWWNPYDNLGQPLAGDPTAAVFYPGKAIFFLASAGLLSFGLCFKLYIWAHVALAWLSARRLARGVGVSRVGAEFSGLAYAFSGQVLFQYSNVIYLVGAAWAPFLLLYALQFRSARAFRAQLRAVLKFSIVASLAILGGEPQIVYLILGFSSVALIMSPSRFGTWRLMRSRLCSTFFFAFASCVVTFALAAAQILPTLEFVARSDRSDVQLPRSIWEIQSAHNNNLPYPNAKFFDVMFCQDFDRDGSNGASANAYRFSVGPWRWLEFFYPDFGGRQFPQMARWYELNTEETAVWSPTLYMGLLPAILALGAFKWRTKRRERPTMETARENFRMIATRMLFLALLAALGGYGIGWFYRIGVGLFTGKNFAPNFHNGDPIGGLYWLLNLLAPKFSEFRYPAKLMTLAAVAIALLAGFGWDLVRRRSRRFIIISCVVIVFALVGVIFCVAIANVYGSDALKLLQISPNALYGPFQPTMALAILFRSLLHAIIVGTITIALFAVMRRAKARMKTTLALVILATVASDLYVANSWTIVTVPEDAFVRKSTILPKLDPRPNAPPPRVFRSPAWFSSYFPNASSPQRNLERVLWDVETLFPKYPMVERVAILNSRGAMLEKEFARYLNAAMNRPILETELAFLGVERVVGPESWVWLVFYGVNSPNSWGVAVRDVSEPPKRAILIQDDIKQEQNLTFPNAVETLSYSENEIVYLVSSSGDATLVCAEQFWPDWRATLIPVKPDEGKTLLDAQYNRRSVHALLANVVAPRTSRDATPIYAFCRAINVPKGLHCVVVSYRPRMIYLGLAASACAWLAICFASMATRLKKTRKEE